MTDPNWYAGPDRTDDPEIKRGLIPKLVTWGAKKFTKGRSYEFMRVLAIDGRLFLPYLLWNSRLMPRGKLPRWQTEAVILRTAWICRSEYEWTQHRAIGIAAGLSKEQAAAAGPEPESELFDATTRAMLVGAGELIEDHRLSDATYETLRGALAPKRVQEYIMLVGTYAALAGSLNTFGAQIEEAWRRS
jgi:alkylhydroperoxidase family enzyme